MGKAMTAVICITHVLSITAAAIPSCCRPLITHFHNLAAICNCLQASTHFGDKSKIFGGGNCKRKVARSFSLRSVRPNADAELERTCPSTSLEAARIPLKRQQEKLTTSQERRKQIKPSDDALESQWKLFQRSLRKLPCIPKIENANPQQLHSLNNIMRKALQPCNISKPPGRQHQFAARRIQQLSLQAQGN
jgi:hypothetical protein